MPWWGYLILIPYLAIVFVLWVASRDDPKMKDPVTRLEIHTIITLWPLMGLLFLWLWIADKRGGRNIL